MTWLHPFLVAIFPLLFFTYFLIKWLKTPISTQKNQPPSPPKLPIIGNLHQLGIYLNRSLLSLAQRYGPDLMLLHFGSKPVLIVSSSTAAREIMKTHDIVFSSRPKTGPFEKLLYNSRDVAGAPYGEYWRHMRSICVLHILSNKRVQSYRSVREEEIALMVEKIRQFSSKSLAVNLSHMFTCYANDVICRVAFGKKYSGESGEEGKKFQELFGEFMRILGSYNIGEFIPWLGWINRINGFDSAVDKTAKEFDQLIDGIVEGHINDSTAVVERKDEVQDFVHVLLELQKEYSMSGNSLDRDSIKALILDMFVGGSDTSSTVLEWAMTELIRHPRVMKELQNEVRRVADEKSNISEADLDKLNYLKLVIKEALRLHTPLPLLAPRETTQDVKVMGYDIAEGTMVLVNYWALARDPKIWTNPEEYWPERFLNNSVDFRGHDFEFIPFGAGRRGCPGISFAMPVIELVLANLVKNFEWALPDGAKGEDLDITESFAITVRKKNALLVVAKPVSG